MYHGDTVAPEVAVVERKLWKRRGEDAVLECDIVAQPIEDYFWERLAYRLRNNPGKYTLEVPGTSFIVSESYSFCSFKDYII